MSTGCRHFFEPTGPWELVCFDGVFVMDGVLGGSDGAILGWWDDRPDNKQFDEDIAKSVKKSCYLLLKRFYKINDNEKVAEHFFEGDQMCDMFSSGASSKCATCFGLHDPHGSFSLALLADKLPILASVVHRT